MEQNSLEKGYYLDYSNRLELCFSVVPDEGAWVTEASVGTAMCSLLNIGLPSYEKIRQQLYKLLPLNTADPDAYAVMLSVNLGNTPLPESPYAAKLFGLLGEIAELHPLFFMAMRFERLLLLFEQNAPEKSILQRMAATSAKGAQALDTALAELPDYIRRIGGILNHTLLEEQGKDKDPLLSRGFAYQKKEKDPILQFRKPPAYTLFFREENRIAAVMDDFAPQEELRLFYGESLVGSSFSIMLRLLFQHMLLNDAVVRVCGVCGRYFVPSVRSNEKYCDSMMPDQNGVLQTCKQRSTKNRLENDASLRLLKGAYDKNFIKTSRKKDSLYRETIFKPWYAWAKEQRQAYLDGTLSLVALTERLGRKMEVYLKEPDPPAFPMEPSFTQQLAPFADFANGDSGSFATSDPKAPPSTESETPPQEDIGFSIDDFSDDFFKMSFK